MIRLAVIADPHYHHCPWIPAGSGLSGAVRSYRDTAASTRVFNESGPAFRAALDRAVVEGARHALIVGDLTDDGQGPNIDAAVALLADYRARHGLRIFSTPGNHDFFAVSGRPQSKGFLSPDGERVTVRSDRSPDAATLGAADALGRMSMLGYAPDPADLHWETPFGTAPDLAARTRSVESPDGSAACPIVDASYLVEPVDGLWILSLDANVAVPRNGATGFADERDFHDPTDGGWTAAVRHRRHLLAWMTDVARRAEAGGKRLVAFSHYPVLDPLGGAAAEEKALFGATGLARRAPAASVADLIAATGIAVHFSGHLHVNDTAHHASAAGRIVNVAVPSPVGFPPAMKMVDVARDGLEIRTLPLAAVTGHDIAYADYRREARRNGEAEPQASRAPDHGAFMDRHLADLVAARYLPREWPDRMRAFVETATVGDLLALVGVEGLAPPAIDLMDLVVDWYRLRKGGEAAGPYVPAERLRFYRALCAALPAAAGDDLAGDFTRFLRIMAAYMGRAPNGDFTLPATGPVTA